MNNEKFYKNNEERFNKYAIDNNGDKLKSIISVGYGQFIKVNSCGNFATIINIDEITYEKTSVVVFLCVVEEYVNGVNKND